MRRLCVFITLLLCLTVITAQDKVAYDTLFNRVNRLPSEEVIKLGDEYLKKEHLDTAIVLYSIVYSRFRDDLSEEEKLFCALGYLKIANVYYMQGNYTNSLELYIKGLKICESCKDKTEISRFYNNIGNIYNIFQDYEKGIAYYEAGYEVCKQYPNKEVEYSLLTNLSGICSYVKEMTKARKYYYEAEKLKQPGDTLKNYFSLLDWGLILKHEGNYPRAIHFFRKAAEFSLKYIMYPSYLCSSYEELYRTYLLLGKDDSTMHYLHLCKNEAERNNLLHKYSESLKTLSALYEKKGDVKNAMFYKDYYLTLTDSIFNVREFNRVKNVQYLYEMEKTTKEISSLQEDQVKKEREIKQQRRILLFILSGTIIISLLLLLVYVQKRKIQRGYRDLFNINREIIESQKQHKDIHQYYKEKLQQKEELLIVAYAELGQSCEPGDEISAYDRDGENRTEDTGSKYQTSSLSDDQKQALLDAIAEIMENTREFCESDFSLEKLSTLVNSNSKYVSQVINETYRKNFSNYVSEYRIREACVRLMDIERYGNYTIKAIAESVGYKSHATFINVFRKVTGITPSIYQKMAKEQA